jgi:hypothetical protein
MGELASPPCAASPYGPGFWGDGPDLNFDKKTGADASAPVGQIVLAAVL